MLTPSEKKIASKKPQVYSHKAFCQNHRLSETGVLHQNFIYRLIQLLQIKDPQFLLILLFSDLSSDKPFIQHLL